MRYVTVARAADVPPGEARVFELGEAGPVAVFNVGGTLHACKSVCPHRGGPLGEGDFDGRLVTCPWHGWQFDVTTGVNPLMPAARLETCPVEVADGDIRIGLP